MSDRRLKNSRDVLAAVETAPAELIPSLLTLLAARLAESAPAAAAPIPCHDSPARRRWLTVQQVAERCGKTPRWVYRRCHQWDFTCREGRSLLFDERGLEAYMQRRRLNGGD
jgi:predicted DNA-binding transcriptional regulator AlpA